MRTPSHLIITAALRRGPLAKVKIATPAFLVGAVAPDLPLYLLSVGRALYLYLTQGRPITSVHSFMFNDLYFSDPLWIIAHNTLHAPLVLLAVLALTWRYRAAGTGSGFALFWFFAACLFHTALDIPTHATDGPLLLFPFNWHYRFHSPISYWDPAHHGTLFSLFEYSLDILLLLYLFLKSPRPQARAG